MLLRILSYFLNSRFYSKLRSEVVTWYSKLEKLKLWTAAFYKVANSPNSWFLKWTINFWQILSTFTFSFDFLVLVCVLNMQRIEKLRILSVGEILIENQTWCIHNKWNLKFSDNIYHVCSLYKEAIFHWMCNFTFYFKILVFRF